MLQPGAEVEVRMKPSDSLEGEILALKQAGTAFADRLDALSLRVPPEQRHILRVLRAQALGLCDVLDEVVRPPASARRRRTAA